MTSSRTRETLILAALTVVVGAISTAMVLLELSRPLEAVGVVTGALCVWLVVRESIWNFPLGMASVAAFLVVFSGARLFADAGLQVVYFALNAAGWYLWLRGGREKTALAVSRVGRREATVLAVAGSALTMVLWLTLRHVGGSASFFDALTTSLSLCAQWMLNRKQVESWYLWITVDVIYVPLYAYKELYLTAGLYAVFLVMATMGLLHWRATWRASAEPAPHPGSGAVAA